MSRQPPETGDATDTSRDARPDGAADDRPDERWDERWDERRLELLGGETSLLDAVDGLLNQGVSVTGDLVLGLADVDLVYLRLSALLAAADRVFGGRGEDRAPAPPAPPAAPSGRADTRRTPVEPSRMDRTEGATPAERSGPAAPPAARVEAADLDTLRGEVEEGLSGGGPGRWNAEPDDVERSVAKLVLTLVELVRQLLERQAIRRMEEETLTEDEVERIGRALMRLESTVADMAGRFGLDPEDLNLDLGPLGRLI